jgi:hypothetical protein
MEVVGDLTVKLFQPGNTIFIRFENDRLPSCTPFVHKTYLWDTRLNRMGDRRLLHSCGELQLGCSLEDKLIQLFDSYLDKVLVLEQF